MASITFKNLEKTSGVTSAATYTDLHLDIIGYPIGAPRDILVDNDLDAIRNSLSNLFSTVPGQKLLNPTYGLNLLQYLFEPVTTNTANIIGETILNGITRFEPRVTVDKVRVVGNAEANEYNITLTLRIPSFPSKDPLKLNAILSKNSTFTFV
jgi:phage baseplate assembly protein W